MVSRRLFLQTACAGGVATAFPASLAFASLGASDKRFVFVLLRGGMDGLSTLVPFGDSNYKRQRGRLAFDRGQLINLDGFFGLPDPLKKLAPLYKSGELSFFHGMSIPFRTRSHFDAQNVLETGMRKPGGRDGWVNRAVKGCKGCAVSVGTGLPLVAVGDNRVLTYNPRGGNAKTGTLELLSSLYRADAKLANAFEAALTFDDRVGDDIGRGKDPASLAKAAGQVLKPGGAPSVAVLEMSGWDTHRGQGTTSGSLAPRHRVLADMILNLKSGLGSRWRDTVVVVATEFGRTVRPNGSNGTDHGAAGVAIAAGGALKGGRVIADWNGLANNKLHDGRDLMPTADVRSLLKTVLHEHQGVSKRLIDREIFPDSGSASYQGRWIG